MYIYHLKFATLFLDQLCYAKLILPPDELESSYDVVLCRSFSVNGSCIFYEADMQFSSTVEAPFVYANQCRNALILYQVPIIILGGIVSAFAMPFLSLSLLFFPYEKVSWFSRVVDSVFSLYPYNIPIHYIPLIFTHNVVGKVVKCQRGFACDMN